MTPVQTENVGEKVPIRRGRVDSLTIYEITDYELDILAAGSPSSIFLNFAIALLSLAGAGIYSLLTATYTSDTTKTVAILITIVGFALGLVLVALWLRSNKSISAIVCRIKARVPTESQDQSNSSQTSS